MMQSQPRHRSVAVLGDGTGGDRRDGAALSQRGKHQPAQRRGHRRTPMPHRWSCHRRRSRPGGRACTSHTRSSPTCWRGTRARRIGPRPSSTTKACSRSGSRWAGKKTPRRMNGDTREWWIVQSGSLRFTVDGREPVVATKGVMVQVPYRTFYQIENTGSEPALRFEVNVTRARKLYPMDETPEAVKGFEYVPTRVTGGTRRARSTEPAGRGFQQGGGRSGTRRRIRHRRSQLREHHHGAVPEAAAGQQGPLSRRGRRVLADHARQDPLQHRRARRSSKPTKATSCTCRGRRGISRASADRKGCARAVWR